jgi:hypothetical protein
MVSESQFGDKTVTSTTKVGDQSVKIEMQGEKGMTSVIFRGGKQVFWMINDQDKTYREMTKAQMEEMAAKLEKAKAQMADSMKNMPPQQQAMMKKLMGGKMAGGAADALPHYVKKASGEKAGKWTADRYEAEKASGLQKIWTVPYGTLGLKESDLAALKEIAKFFEIFGQNKSDFFKFDRKDLGYTGIPVKTEVIEKDKTVSSTLLKEAGPKSFPASDFDLPAGYAKKEMKGL